MSGSATDLSKVGQTPIAPCEGVEEDFDPFDTSAVSALVQPKATELKFLEQELITENSLKHSLSDPDFNPRAEEAAPAPTAAPVLQLSANTSIDLDIAERKSSLSLQIQPKSVGFLVPDSDLLSTAHEAAGNKKPLTPYYAPKQDIANVSAAEEDPFYTTFVPAPQPSEVELKHIEKNLLASSKALKHSISDPDFDPRAPPTPVPAEELLTVRENINTKVLTPAQESKDFADEESVDPFDTSIASNLQPGKTELKLLENEFLPEISEATNLGVLDVQSDAQELGLGDKVLTPSLPHKQLTLTEEEVDPFDTSIAENLAPGETEIKLLESELIEK